jgi:ribonuclease R
MKENVLNIIKKKSINFELLLEISKIERTELENILKELIQENLIFINSVNKYEFKKEGLFIGTLERNSKGISYVVINNEKIIIPAEELHTALKYDTVVIEITHENKGTIKGIIERKNNKLVCEVKAYNNKLILVPFNGNCELHLITDQELLKDLIVGDRVYTTLPNKINDDNIVTVNNITKIGHFNDSFNDEMAIAISKGFDIEFSKKAMEEAENLPKYVREDDKVNRVDLTDKTIYTIDSIHTKDIDDAISIERLENGNILLGVHIADVAHYIKPGSELFNEALKRKTSVYIGELVIPMLPSIISNGICSLNPGEERLARSTFIEYTPKGKVKNYYTCKSVIKSKKKMTYEDLNNYFTNNEIDPSYFPFINEINEMRNLSELLTRIKISNGYLEFESNDMEVKTNPYNNEIIGFENRISSIADKIIEFFMVECNVIRAKDFNIKSIPILYRVHDKPDGLKLEDTFELIKELGFGKQLVRVQNSYGPRSIQNILHHYQSSPLFSVISNLLLRSMARAKDSVENIGHFALAEEFYCHSTAPIRRFPDFMLQTTEDLFSDECIGYNYIDEIRKSLCEIADDYNYKERQANDAEIDFAKLRMAEFMATRTDEEFIGMILDIDKDKIYVKLDNNVKGILDMDSDFGDAFYVDTYRKELICRYSKQRIKLGTKLILKVSRVDIPQKEVYFSVCDILKENKVNEVSVKKRVRSLH